MRIFAVLIGIVVLVAGYLLLVSNWSFSEGERVGWVQKFSSKGWLCKTWEGEMAFFFNDTATTEKFFFTVWDDATAEEINKVMGKRVSLHYEEKVGIPSRCFGETRYYVTKVSAVSEIPLAPGVVVPTQPAPAAPSVPTKQ